MNYKYLILKKITWLENQIKKKAAQLITKEYAGGKEPHVGQGEMEVTACRGQEEHTGSPPHC